MADEPTEPEDVSEAEADAPEAATEADAAVATETEESPPTDADASSDDGAGIPEFTEIEDRTVHRLDSSSERLHEVCVPVWVELGRIEMQIGELLRLGEGSVVRLNRSVGEPVDLISQGVKLAHGEVVVVNDNFGIRIREVVTEQK